MRTLSTMRPALRIAILTSVVGAWGMLTYACSVGVENPALPDSGISTPSTSPTADGTIATAPICGKYGGSPGVKSIADAILSAAENDCRIMTTFKPNPHASACFALFVESVFQCGNTFVVGTTQDLSETCTGYLPGVSLSATDFAAFIDDVNATLVAKGVVLPDSQTVSTAITQTQSSIATDTDASSFTSCTCEAGADHACVAPPPPDAGIDSGPKDSGPKDTGPKDTGPKDTGPKDTGSPDTGDAADD